MKKILAPSSLDLNPVFINSIYIISARVSGFKMKSKQTPQTCTLEFPITIDFLDLGTVEQVVAEAFFKEPKKRRKKA